MRSKLLTCVRASARSIIVLAPLIAAAPRRSVADRKGRAAMIRKVGLAVVALLVPAMAFSHVVVSPRQSTTGAYEKYVVRVPTEGKVATQSVELQVPEGVIIVSMGAPAGFSYELKRTGDKVTAIVWTMNIKPGEFAEFAFMARNPASGGSLKWNAIQRFVDGTSTEWTGSAGTRRPASVTQIAPGGSGHTH